MPISKGHPFQPNSQAKQPELVADVAELSFAQEAVGRVLEVHSILNYISRIAEVEDDRYMLVVCNRPQWNDPSALANLQ